MPTYERWKFCGYILPDGTRCGSVAYNEDIEWTKDSPNPQFLCNDHMDMYDAEQEEKAFKEKEKKGE